MRKSNAKETIEQKNNHRYRLLLEGAIVGLLAGAVVSLFRLSLEKAQELRNWYIFASGEKIIFGFLGIFVIAFLAMLIVVLVKKIKYISGSGIPQVEGELKGQIETVWWKVLIGKFVGSVLAIGGGLSLGREGPSVQLGAMVGKGFSRLTKKLRTEEKLLTTCGAGAGLAAAFNAPLTGVVFVLEEIHKTFSTEVLLTTMAAAVTSDFVSSSVIGLDPVFSIDIAAPLPLLDYWTVILLGVILGAMGVFFNSFVGFMQNMYDRMKLKVLRVIIPALGIVIFAFVYPVVLGSGHDIVGMVCKGDMLLPALIVLFLLKYLFFGVSFGSGAPGGSFLPLLVLGSVLGGIYGQCMEMLNIGEEYLVNYVVLAMAGYFAAIVKDPITGIILITEMTGDFSSLLPLAIVSLAAYIVSDALKGQPIYQQQLNRLLRKQGIEEEENGHKVLIVSDIYFGCEMDNERITNLQLPKGCLIVSVERDQKELIPNGQTVLVGGDKITILCDEKHMVRAENILDAKCRRIKTI